MRSRRALLYMPGDDLHKIQKGAALGADCICMDIEDGVAPNRKENARTLIPQALRGLAFGRSERLVRVNGFATGLTAGDLDAVLPARPDGIVLPKAQGPDDVRAADAIMTSAEIELGLPINSIALLVLIETARAVVYLPEICASVPRLQALIFGSDDLAVDLGAVRTRPAWEMFYARSAVVLHAAAFNLQAIDMVSVDFRDIAALREEALQGAGFGYSGKQVIHPNQVAPVQEAFTPGDEAIARARSIAEAAAQHHLAGRGAFVLDGKMVDTPVIQAAHRILDRARAAGKI